MTDRFTVLAAAQFAAFDHNGHHRLQKSELLALLVHHYSDVNVEQAVAFLRENDKDGSGLDLAAFCRLVEISCPHPSPATAAASGVPLSPQLLDAAARDLLDWWWYNAPTSVGGNMVALPAPMSASLTNLLRESVAARYNAMSEKEQKAFCVSGAVLDRAQCESLVATHTKCSGPLPSREQLAAARRCHRRITNILHFCEFFQQCASHDNNEKKEKAFEHYRSFFSEPTQMGSAPGRRGQEFLDGLIDVHAVTPQQEAEWEECRSQRPPGFGNDAAAAHVVSLSYRDRALAILAAHAPEKVCRIDEFFSRFSGEEERMIAAMAEKYGSVAASGNKKKKSAVFPGEELASLVGRVVPTLTDTLRWIAVAHDGSCTVSNDALLAAAARAMLVGFWLDNSSSPTTLYNIETRFCRRNGGLLFVPASLDEAMSHYAALKKQTETRRAALQNFIRNHFVAELRRYFAFYGFSQVPKFLLTSTAAPPTLASILRRESVMKEDEEAILVSLADWAPEFLMLCLPTMRSVELFREQFMPLPEPSPTLMQRRHNLIRRGLVALQASSFSSSSSSSSYSSWSEADDLWQMIAFVKRALLSPSEIVSSLARYAQLAGSGMSFVDAHLSLLEQIVLAVEDRVTAELAPGTEAALFAAAVAKIEASGAVAAAPSFARAFWRTSDPARDAALPVRIALTLRHFDAEADQLEELPVALNRAQSSEEWNSKLSSLVLNVGAEPDSKWRQKSAAKESDGRSHRERLLAFYNKYAPERVPAIDEILVKYGGCVSELFAALVAKYGPEPSAAAAAASSSSSSPATILGARSRYLALDYRTRLVNFYQHYHPDKLPHVVDAALSKYAGREDELFEALEAKYGPEAAFWCQLERAPGDCVVPTYEERIRWMRTASGGAPMLPAEIEKSVAAFRSKGEKFAEKLLLEAKLAREPESERDAELVRRARARKQ